MLSSSEASPSATTHLIVGSASAVSTLTARELQVLRLMADPLHEREIANELHLSTHTVLNHIRNIRTKLETPNRLEAVLVAQRLGLL